MSELEDKAIEFATKAHGDQKYGTYPYERHLSDVAAVAKFHKLPEAVQIAAWLHDTLEDTNTRYNEIVHAFGSEIAILVYAVTNEYGKTRKERNAKTYPKIKANKLAISLKLCDRIANLKFSIAQKDTGKVGMYLKEHEEFKLALYTNGDWKNLWDQLEALIVLGKSLIQA